MDQDRKNIDKIPGISSLPLLGKLFSKQKDDKSKTENRTLDYPAYY